MKITTHIASSVNGMSGLKKAVLSGGCALAALMVPSVAAAQDAAAAAAEETTGMEEIVVTAQKRSERLENVPMAVTALTANALEKASVVNLHEIGRITPGVQINFGGLSTQPAIRGVTSLTNGTGNENNVAVYVDGFYVSDNTSINQDLANLQSIQVLKGPQGTLYGRQATGGAILINTLDPTDELSGKFEGSYGKFSEKKLNGYISAPLSEKVGFMVAGAFRNSDGWIGKSDPTNNQRNAGTANPQKQRALRAKIKAEISDDLKATLAYNYGLSSDPSGILFTPFEHIPATVPGGNQRAASFGTASYNSKALASSSTNEATLKVEWQTPVGTLTSYSGYAMRKHRVAFDFDGTYADLTFSDSTAKQKTYQQALDFVVTEIEHVDLVIGGLYFNDKYYPVDGGQKNYGANRVLLQRVLKPLKTEAYAIYADATVHVTDKLTVGVGGRYSHDDKYVSQTNINAAGVVTFPFTENQKSFKRFTPRATIRYTVADRTNVYASYSKGFRSGSFNSSPAATPALLLPIKPEDIQAYEIGFKTAQSIFRFEAAAFYYDYKNLNVSLLVQNPVCAGQPVCGTATITGNAPKATIKGLDAQLVATPVDKLNISIGGAYLKARYGRFANAIGTGLNATTNLNVSGQVQDWTHKQMARAPQFSANLNVDYTVPVAEGELRLSGNVNYSDSYVVSNPSLFGPTAGAALAGKQRFRQGSTTLANGEITWFAPEGRYWVGLYGKNLTNKKYRLTYNGGANGDYSTKAPPISYGVKVGYKF